MQQTNHQKEDVMGPSPFVYIFMSVGAISLFSFVAVASWADARRREREAFYKSEITRKIIETQGTGASSALELIREKEKIAARRRSEGIKLGGLVTTAVGIGLLIFLRVLIKDEPVYLSGTIPLLIGVAFLVYAYILGPKE
jgi:hypothetical protein